MKKYEVWKVLFEGEGDTVPSRKRHWIIVDKIVAEDESVALEDVMDNLASAGYEIISSNFPNVITEKGDETVTFVISPAGKEYKHDDWDETIAPEIGIREVTRKKKK